MNEKIKACLVAGALGDAYGSRFEQMDLPTGYEEWQFTDDTQLTVATCEAIMESEKVDPAMVAVAFQRWYHQNALSGLGASTLRAIIALVGGADARHSGATGEQSAGNGAAMRIAPLAFLLDPGKEEDREVIRDVCRITHQNEEAYVGALAVVYAIRFIQNDRQNFISNVIRQLPDTQVRDKLIAISQTPNLRIRDIARKHGCSGFVAESVPLALFAAQQAQEIGLQAMMKEIVAAGGDTDTNCSIAGHVAGASLGMEAIPEEWLQKLRKTRHFDSYYETFKDYSDFVGKQLGIGKLF